MNDSMLLLPDIKLRFNIEHPSLEESYVYGYECARADISEDENPFVYGSKESDNWIDGWWAGFYGEPAQFSLAEDTLSCNGSANDHIYHDQKDHRYFVKFLEISGAIVISMIVGYQLIEMVA